jgi:hypothetical protein
MFIVINKNTKKIKQTIDSNYGLRVSENESLQEITDSELINKIAIAHDYELIFDGDNVIDITVTKTIAEWIAEQPIPEPEPSMEDYLLDYEFRISNLELGV